MNLTSGLLNISSGAGIMTYDHNGSFTINTRASSGVETETIKLTNTTNTLQLNCNMTNKLTTDDSSTKFEILNNTGGTLFSIDGAGTLAPAIGGSKSSLTYRLESMTNTTHTTHVITFPTEIYTSGSDIGVSGTGNTTFTNVSGEDRNWNVSFWSFWSGARTVTGNVYDMMVIYKNGSQYDIGQFFNTRFGASDLKASLIGSTNIAMASTDYLDFRLYSSTGSYWITASCSILEI
jgi:hypothetical protein